LGALAIANDGVRYPEPAAILEWTTTKIRNAITSYATDGGWPEGPGYWLYATRYTCAMISALQSALGSDFGLSDMPGFAETGTLRMACIEGERRFSHRRIPSIGSLEIKGRGLRGGRPCPTASRRA
jgi:hypothetical protein